MDNNNQNPEQKALDQIDRQLLAAGWLALGNNANYSQVISRKQAKNYMETTKASLF